MSWLPLFLILLAVAEVSASGLSGPGSNDYDYVGAAAAAESLTGMVVLIFICCGCCASCGVAIYFCCVRQGRHGQTGRVITAPEATGQLQTTNSGQNQAKTPSPVYPPNPPYPTGAPYPTQPAAGAYPPHPSQPTVGAYPPYPSQPAAGAYSPYPSQPAAGAYAPYPSQPAAGTYAPYPQNPSYPGGHTAGYPNMDNPPSHGAGGTQPPSYFESQIIQPAVSDEQNVQSGAPEGASGGNFPDVVAPNYEAEA